MPNLTRNIPLQMVSLLVLNARMNGQLCCGVLLTISNMLEWTSPPRIVPEISAATGRGIIFRNGLGW